MEISNVPPPKSYTRDNAFFALCLGRMSEGCGGRFIDQAQYFQTCDASRVFGRLPLRVVGNMRAR